MAQWYYRSEQDKLEHGPISVQEIRYLVQDGTLTRQHELRKEGTDKWTRAADVQGLKFGQNSKTTTPPPLANAYPAAPPEESLSVMNKGTEAFDRAQHLIKEHPKQVLFLAIGMGIFMLGFVSGCQFGRIGMSSFSQGVVGSQTLNEQMTKGHVDMTTSEFRKAVRRVTRRGRVPKDEFFEEFGKPKSVTSVGGTVFLNYVCTDADVRVEVNSAMWKALPGAPEGVFLISIDENY